MEPLREALALLRMGLPPNRRAARALAASDDPVAVDAALAALPALRSATARRTVLACLAAVAERPSGLAVLAAPPRALLLGHALAVEPAPWYDPLSALSSGGTFFDQLTSADCHQKLRAIFERLGPAGLVPLRRIIDGPRLPVALTYDANGNCLGAYGAKRTACEIVGRWGDESDVARFAGLTRDETESPWVRVLAGVAWVRTAGEAALSEVLAACFDPDLHNVDDYACYAADLARIGPALVAPMIEKLSAPRYTDRHRAVQVLRAVGQPAVPALTALVCESDDWRVVHNAEEVLRAIDRSALRRAQRERESAERRISLAPHRSDAGRGLSRPEPDDA